MPSAQWKLRYYHAAWYPDETLSVAIGQGAVAATPLQLVRVIGGIASGGHLVRPHVVLPDQLPKDFHQAVLDSYPGSGEKYIPIDPENWVTITDGMADVTQPGYFHTAGSAHLEGIDFGGKTGTAQLMSHQALETTNKGRQTYPNVWFVGVTPRRNPELVVCVLWQNGEFSYYPARIGAEVVSAYVAKQRRLANNLVLPPKKPAPVEMGAMWTSPNPNAVVGNKQGSPDQVQAGNFLVQNGKIVAQSKPGTVTAKPASSSTGQPPTARTGQAPALQSKRRQTPAPPAKQEEASIPASRKGE
jgi:penicillin-binding protein 2